MDAKTKSIEDEKRVRSKIVAWVASELHDFERLDDLLAKMRGRLAEWLPEAALVPMQDCQAEDCPVLLVMTGGTERSALEWLSRCSGRVTLLAHPAHNSMAACLEILARLRQSGRHGRVMLFDGSESNRKAMRDRWEMRRVHLGMQAARIALVGEPSDWLVASVPAQEKVRQRWGLELLHLGLDELERAEEAVAEEELAKEASRWESQAGRMLEPASEDLPAAIRTALIRLR